MTGVLLALGLGAGALSTVAGLGGGMLLVLALSAWLDPRSALVMTTPALLGGNLHRFWLFRAHLERRVAGAFILGAVPGAVIGSLITVVLPERVLAFVLLAVAALAAARGLNWIRWTPKPGALAPAGLAAGALAASGGAGLLISPLLLAAGVRGDAFIATTAASALAIHIGRSVGYGLGGLFDPNTLSASAFLALGVFAGNFLGRQLRRSVSERVVSGLTYTTLGVCLALALAGLA